MARSSLILTEDSPPVLTCKESIVQLSKPTGWATITAAINV